MMAAMLPAQAASSVDLRAGGNSLLEIGNYRIGYQRLGEAPRLLPAGWVGHFERETGVSYTPWTDQAGKRALLIHCPWRGPTGITFVEYDVGLPERRPVTFSFAIAMWAETASRSDGVTFRVLVRVGEGEQEMLNKHCTQAEWEEHRADLSGYAGQSTTLRLEVAPGPNSDPSFDHSLWGDPIITVGDETPSLREQVAEMMADPAMREELQRGVGELVNVGRASVAPSVAGERRAVGPVMVDKTFVWISEGDDGRLTYTLDPSLPFLRGLTARRDDGVPVPLGAGSGPVLVTRDGEVGPDQLNRTLKYCTGEELAEQYAAGDTVATLRTKIGLQGRSLRIEVEADEPTIARLDFGGLGPVAWRRQVPTPYLTDNLVYYLADQRLFASSLLDWTHSRASRVDGTAAVYGAKTDHTRNPLRERAFITVSPHYAEVLPNIPNPPSPYRDKLRDYIVIDNWGGTFDEDHESLDELARSGIHSTVVLKHFWQRDGYDNGYPNVIPANRGLGGDEALRRCLATAHEYDHLYALHENYVDFYPNSELYDEGDVALDSAGELVRAWFNRSTKIQSFAYKPTAIMKYAKIFSPQIRERYGTRACFLDVHSAVPPWFHVDFRAGEPGAAEFRTVWDAHRQLWQHERDMFQGPVLGEGARHWYWSGCLDGVEAQLAERDRVVPIVDFDLLKIHPLQFNHGMGYLGRWLSNDDGSADEAITDRYRAMEVAFGHAGFLDTRCWRWPSLAAREYYLMRAVMDQYATANPVRIRYLIAGTWAPASVAAALGAADRLHVQYDNGLDIWVNLSATNWETAGQTLPPDGWYALNRQPGSSLECGTVTQDGLIVDRCLSRHDSKAFSPGSVAFFDARGTTAARHPAFRDIKPAVARFGPLDDRRFRISYAFAVRQGVDRDYHVFVHFVDPTKKDAERIAFQQDHDPERPTSEWDVGDVIADGPWEVVVPDHVAPGRYELRLGLYDETGRIRLLADLDRWGCALLGTLVVEGKGDVVTGVGWEPAPPYAPAAESRRNPKKEPIDFGPVVTAGCVAIEPAGEHGLSIRALPPGERVTVVLRPQEIDSSLSLTVARIHARDRQGRTLREIESTVDQAAGTLSFETSEPTAEDYLADFSP